MFRVILKRAIVAMFIISGSFAFIYGLAATIGDPLAEIRLSNPPNLEYLLLAATRELRLDQSIPERFLGWYIDVWNSIFSGDFTLGIALNGRPVSEGLFTAIAPTFLLVGISIALSLFLGAVLGVVVAVKRNGLREAAFNLISFLGYVAPVFFIGHLIKQYGVVIVNDGASKLLNWYEILATFSGSLFFLFFATFSFLSQYSFDDQKARKKFSISLVIAIPLMSMANYVLPGDTSYLYFFISSVLTVLLWVIFWSVLGVGMVHRFSFGRRFGVIWLLALVIQKLIATLPIYMQRDEIGGRPFPSFAYESVWYTPPEFWIVQLDRALHLILPAFAITITTLALYYQVTKATAIEALEADYVKMARAKGISDLEVLIRHVFRSCYLSLTNTFVPNYLYLFNGVIITELVFGWQGIGVFIMNSLFSYDLNKLMGGVFVIGIATFISMLGSDLLSNRIDPRIREFE